MWSFFQFIFFITITIVSIYYGHILFDYAKETFTKPVEKNMYTSHIEKYKQMLQDVQYHDSMKQEKIEMENELLDFMEQKIQEK